MRYFFSYLLFLILFGVICILHLLHYNNRNIVFQRIDTVVAYCSDGRCSEYFKIGFEPKSAFSRDDKIINLWSFLPVSRSEEILFETKLGLSHDDGVYVASGEGAREELATGCFTTVNKIPAKLSSINLLSNFESVKEVKAFFAYLLWLQYFNFWFGFILLLLALVVYVYLMYFDVRKNTVNSGHKNKHYLFVRLGGAVTFSILFVLYDLNFPLFIAALHQTVLLVFVFILEALLLLGVMLYALFNRVFSKRT